MTTSRPIRNKPTMNQPTTRRVRKSKIPNTNNGEDHVLPLLHSNRQKVLCYLENILKAIPSLEDSSLESIYIKLTFRDNIQSDSSLNQILMIMMNFETYMFIQVVNQIFLDNKSCLKNQ